ncbi:MAG: outer membrane beta-barrel protein [Ignavibacteriales bacterium]|nr:outer membrane beta-barrel protein [Ignavibacteriales bacterium]
MTYNFQKLNFCSHLTVLTFILVFNVQLYGQDDDEKSYNRFYLIVQSSIFAGTNYPTFFDAYKATGPAAANYFYAREFGTSSSKVGFGGGFGYQLRNDIFMISMEVNYSINSHPDSKEVLSEELFNGTDFSRQNFTTTFSQTELKNSNLLLFGSAGVFPFAQLDLSFYITGGLGFEWQSFKSDAAAYAETRGYDISTIGKADWYDLGDYERGGKFSRSSFAMMLGLGSEFFITNNISLKADWQYIFSSYTRENVLISSGAVNVYQNSKDYEYKVGNKLALGVAYYFNIGE